VMIQESDGTSIISEKEGTDRCFVGVVVLGGFGGPYLEEVYIPSRVTIWTVHIISLFHDRCL
jgi:hypothetical protein